MIYIIKCNNLYIDNFAHAAKLSIHVFNVTRKQKLQGTFRNMCQEIPFHPRGQSVTSLQALQVKEPNKTICAHISSGTCLYLLIILFCFYVALYSCFLLFKLLRLSWGRSVLIFLKHSGRCLFCTSNLKYLIGLGVWTPFKYYLQIISASFFSLKISHSLFNWLWNTMGFYSNV